MILIYDSVEAELTKAGYKLHGLNIETETIVEKNIIRVFGFSYYHVETDIEMQRRLKKEENTRKKQLERMGKKIQKDKDLLKQLLAKHGRDIIDEI